MTAAAQCFWTRLNIEGRKHSDQVFLCPMRDRLPFHVQELWLADKTQREH